MRSGFRLGRLFGIDLDIDPSWIFIVLLLSANLLATFTRWHPSWSLGLALGCAVAAALLFFASVVLHELAHCLVARAYGTPVRRITLFLFGGMSNIEREPSSPRAEVLMAIAGPALSLVLGFVVLLVAVPLAFEVR